MKNLYLLVLLCFLFFCENVAARAHKRTYTKSETFQNGNVLITLSYTKGRIKKSKNHLTATIRIIDPATVVIQKINIQRSAPENTFESINKVLLKNSDTLAEIDKAGMKIMVFDFISEIDGNSQNNSASFSKSYLMTTGQLKMTYDPNSSVVRLDAVSQSLTIAKTEKFFMVQLEAGALKARVEVFLASNSLTPDPSDSISKGGPQKISTDFVDSQNKKNGQYKNGSVPATTYNFAQVRSDEGWNNGIEFKYCQTAFQYYSGEIRRDTLFKTPPGFVINPDVLTFEVGEDLYVQFTYAPYSNGIQYQLKKTNRTTDTTTIPVVISPITGINGKTLCMKKEAFDSMTKTPRYAGGWQLQALQFTSGQLTVPFKLRPQRIWGADTLAPFRMTTDVTIGVYGGIRWRPKWEYPDFFITIPATGGLTFINVATNATTLTGPAEQISGITPGFTWSTGVIIQYRRTNIGFVFGRDYASDYGRKWIYHNDPWYSFAIGYSFLAPDKG